MKQEAYRLQNDAVRIERSTLPPVVLTYDSEDGWRLNEDYVYDDSGTTIRVEHGFTFDLSSVPRMLWPVIAPFDLSIAAPLLHDFLYRCGGSAPGSVQPLKVYTRSDTDTLFRKIMEQEGVAAWRRCGLATVVGLYRSACVWRICMERFSVTSTELRM